MNNSELDNFQAKFLPLLNERMDAYLQQLDTRKTLHDSMSYSVDAGGKRIRPMIIMLVCDSFKKKIDQDVLDVCASLEFVHTYSLIHDDLPAMDNDEYRRGRKTTHIVYGEAMAILAGDGLLNFAYETALTALQTEQTPNVAKALLVLSQKAGIYGMVGGQTVDVETDQTQSVTRDQLDFIYKLKTSALIEASMLIGAILAGATKSEQKIIEEAASEIGLAFQIQDDILDVTGNQEVLGKPVGSDAKNEKATYVTYEGLKKAQEDVKRYSKHAVNLLESLVVKNEFLIHLVEYLIHREK